VAGSKKSAGGRRDDKKRMRKTAEDTALSRGKRGREEGFLQNIKAGARGVYGLKKKKKKRNLPSTPQEQKNNT